MTYQFSDELADGSIIESLICNIPIGGMVIYGHDLTVIDGNRRLSTIAKFINGDYPLTNMVYSPQFNGAFYKDLPAWLHRRIMDTEVECIWIQHCQSLVLNDLISRYKK